MATKRKPRGNPHDPIRIVMTCPRCPDELHAEEYGPVAVRRCIRCGGTWLDEGELRRILLSPPRPLEPLPPLRPTEAVKRPVRCPKCGRVLDRFEYGDSGICLDRCTGHGTWFDRGELEHIEKYARKKEQGRKSKKGGVLGFLRNLLGRDQKGEA